MLDSANWLQRDFSEAPSADAALKRRNQLIAYSIGFAVIFSYMRLARALLRI
jgi:hypothetical protein